MSPPKRRRTHAEALFSEQQIISALKEVDGGAKVDEVCRKAGVTATTFYGWKAKFGGMT